jgi:hypothetical protein
MTATHGGPLPAPCARPIWFWGRMIWADSAPFTHATGWSRMQMARITCSANTTHTRSLARSQSQGAHPQPARIRARESENKSHTVCATHGRWDARKTQAQPGYGDSHDQNMPHVCSRTRPVRRDFSGGKYDGSPMTNGALAACRPHTPRHPARFIQPPLQQHVRPSQAQQAGRQAGRQAHQGHLPHAAVPPT